MSDKWSDQLTQINVRLTPEQMALLPAAPTNAGRILAALAELVRLRAAESRTTGEAEVRRLGLDRPRKWGGARKRKLIPTEAA